MAAPLGVVVGWLRSVVLGRRSRGVPIITPYCGWGTPQDVELSGRVLLPRRLGPPRREDSAWRNLLASVARLWSLELPGQLVQGELAGCATQTVSDVEGYFTLRFQPEGALAPGWHQAQLRLTGRPAPVRARVLVIGKAPFGIISDLDDTVIQTGATRLIGLLGTVLARNARTRLPFPGVGALYRAFARRGAPVLYVSSSPWNFFDVLWHFLDYRRIPPGPLFLRDWGLQLLRGHGDHKLGAVSRVLDRLAVLPFVLIGDSGEQDPEIYTEVVRRHPGRVLAVYIRDVGGRRRGAQLVQLRQELGQLGVPMLLARDSMAAAQHAMALGLLAPQDARRVAQALRRQGGPGRRLKR